MIGYLDGYLEENMVYGFFTDLVMKHVTETDNRRCSSK